MDKLSFDASDPIIKEICTMDLERLKELIYKTSVVAWANDISSQRIEKWLDNFNGSAIGDPKAEKILAAWMLLNFVFYTLDDVRSFCKSIYEDYIHQKLIEYKESGKLNHYGIPKQIEYIVSNTVFVALGNDSESGSNILYFFRQENHLPKKVFEKNGKANVENIVFIDDVTISGIQACQYIRDNTLIAEKKYLLTFISTIDAIDRLEKEEVTVLSGNVISDREKCFSTDSYVFANEDKNKFLDITKSMCISYGEKILLGHIDLSDHPLGFDDGQQMFGFYYNTPDNSLPIFWCSLNKWSPAFKRYDKIYGRKAVNFDDSIYI